MQSRRDIIQTAVVGGLISQSGCLGQFRGSDGTTDEPETDSTATATPEPQIDEAETPIGGWPMFSANAANTGTVSDQTGPTGDIGEVWGFEEANDELLSPPVVADGVVYVGGLDNHLYAVDAVTGEQQWAFETGDQIEGAAAVADGTVYFGSKDGNLYAADTQTGDQEWVFETDGPIREAAPTVADGTVYFGGEGGRLYAVDATTGRERGSFDIGSFIYSTPAVVDGTVYVGGLDGNLYAVDIKAGDERWSRNLASSIFSSPAVADGTVYVGGYEARTLHALDASTGDVLWQYRQLEGKWDAYDITSSPAVADGAVYAGAKDERIHAVDAETGDRLWTYDTEGEATSPVVVDGTVYVGSAASVRAVDTGGEELWSLPQGIDSNIPSPAVVGGAVYFVDGGLYAYSTP